MINDYTIHQDTSAKELVSAFRKAIQPVLDVAAPNWTLHHIETHQGHDHMMNDRFEVRLIIKPIGSVREVPDRPFMISSPAPEGE